MILADIMTGGVWAKLADLEDSELRCILQATVVGFKISLVKSKVKKEPVTVLAALVERLGKSPAHMGATIIGALFGITMLK